MSSFFNEPDPDENFADGVEYEIVRTQERLNEVAKELASHQLLAVDTENAGIDPHAKWPLLLQIGTFDKCYIFEHYSKLDFSPLKSSLENEDIIKILFNAKYDWKWIFVHYDISLRNVFCSQIAERLLTVGKLGARRRPSLKDVAAKYLGITLKKEARSAFEDRDPIANPITEDEFRYSAADVLILPDIFYQQMERIEEEELGVAARLEFDVLPVVARAEVDGVPIDQERWRGLLDEATKKRAALSRGIYRHFDSAVSQKTLFGVPTFNIGSNSQLQEHLRKLGFDLPNTEEGTLKKFVDEHEVFKLLLEWRGYEKIRGTYGEKLLAKISKKTKCLHCNFNQVQADSGRMSASDPNLQNIPGYDPEDPASLDFRGCFVSRPGRVLITADFSQQELRILADLSGDPTFRKAYLELDEDGKSLDVHRYTASVIFDIPYKEVPDKLRKRAKTLNFFLVYGGSAFSLSETLKISVEEAEEIIANYFKRYGKIKSFLDHCANSGFTLGYARTISGRKRFFPLPHNLDPDSKEFRKEKASIKRKAKNNPMQGGGADVTKLAMVLVDRRLRKENLDAVILMVIHDELVVEAKDSEAKLVAKIVEEEMVNAFTHFFKNIPMVVDAHIGTAWKK